MPTVLRRAWLVFIHDLIMVALAWLGAYWLHNDLHPVPPQLQDQALHWLPWVVCLQGTIFYQFQLYRSLWRFASTPDLLQIGKATSMGAGLIGAASYIQPPPYPLPAAIPVLYALLLFLAVSVPRLIYRLKKDSHREPDSGKRALVVGAGRAGYMLIRDLLQDSAPEYRPVALVDDNPHKLGREIRGIRVVGPCSQIPYLVRRYHIETVLIAIPSASDTQMRRIITHCEQAGVPFLTLPSPRERLNRNQPISKKTLRPVSIEDLLGREPTRLDWPSIHRHLATKTVLVTGGGGSIGAELCRQLANLPIHRLILFERCEYNLYRTERTLREHFESTEIVPVLGDITDKVAVREVLVKYRPEVIFHTAAYKHVPLLENQVREAVHNNVLGTARLAELAVEHGVDKFVLVSTDKAVHPTNVMGATKRGAEVICQSFNLLQKTRFVTVRFGNVLDSAGSVVPLFREQIASGGPVTVTHPEITRFFMTIPEACQLIMQAAALGQGGEIFVLDMGQPVSIRYLAEQMILLSGKRPGIDIAIEYIGLRPGEKLHEELFYPEEDLQPTPYEKLKQASAPACDPKIIVKLLAQIHSACQEFDIPQLYVLLQTLVPEYRPEEPSRESIPTHPNRRRTHS
ncbi:hypothetical protein MIN45_P0058 [Methylomarinovum tepidoasis]|uniref:Polysaccharide biosynthesis protein CapD-like domain-containing protein n=1 Tax=Methylomarinovum tepidoasis TaxID=2840183 RepID=A0AAU9CAK4_9GAMM|nr:nucleoside-diphosphate sugar epimerase/dehydratase [Methylomarinovum sp. IN45]BCX87691.1 hypothetical protein MIN45_P0058 [Methylomarinovum sp. IN45]